MYSHLNYLVRKNDIDLIFVVGPGHGAPAILASLWIEGSLQRFYPQYSRDKSGLHNLITKFSTPGGFPRYLCQRVHLLKTLITQPYQLRNTWCYSRGRRAGLCSSGVVWCGHGQARPYSRLCGWGWRGREWTYCSVRGLLGSSRQLLTSCSAWHAYKYIDPAESGAVLPIVHVNGFKISEPTIYGCMDDKELVALFTGYGYQPRIVDDLDDIDADLAASMQWALDEIRKIQQAARSGKPIIKPRWPVLILRTPKVSLLGWGTSTPLTEPTGLDCAEECPWCRD